MNAGSDVTDFPTGYRAGSVPFPERGPSSRGNSQKRRSAWPAAAAVWCWSGWPDRLSPDGAVTDLVGGVGLSNELDWSDDRKTFYYADSLSGGVDAFGTDQDTGALVSQVTSAAFGGADLSTLYITTAREGFTLADRQAQPHAGDIFACTPGVTGRLPYLFGA